MDRDPFQDQGILPFSSQRPLLGPGDKIGLTQLMDMPVFSLFQSFRHGSLPALSSCSTGMRFGELHLEHPVEDLGFLGSMEAAPQFQGLPIILLIQSKQVRGQVHHGWIVFLRILPLQGLHASPPYPSILFQRWKEPHGGTSNGLFIDLAPLLRMDSNPVLSSDVKKYQQAFLAPLLGMDSNSILCDCI